ncbi:hypothetical protein CLOM_g23562, partial [Closterium sp. NIES-68]
LLRRSLSSQWFRECCPRSPLPRPEVGVSLLAPAAPRGAATRSSTRPSSFRDPRYSSSFRDPRYTPSRHNETISAESVGCTSVRVHHATRSQGIQR